MSQITDLDRQQDVNQTNQILETKYKKSIDGCFDEISNIKDHLSMRNDLFKKDIHLLFNITKTGEVVTLLDVPRYDFNWQLAYQFATPQSISKGTKLKVTGWFDNSERNPANPDPSKTVTFGPQSADEMLVGYVEFIVPGESPAATSR